MLLSQLHPPPPSDDDNAKADRLPSSESKRLSTPSTRASSTPTAVSVRLYRPVNNSSANSVSLMLVSKLFTSMPPKSATSSWRVDMAPSVVSTRASSESSSDAVLLKFASISCTVAPKVASSDVTVAFTPCKSPNRSVTLECTALMSWTTLDSNIDIMKSSKLTLYSKVASRSSVVALASSSADSCSCVLPMSLSRWWPVGE